LFVTLPPFAAPGRSFASAVIYIASGGSAKVGWTYQVPLERLRQIKAGCGDMVPR
jgi:hypothetical protein